MLSIPLRPVEGRNFLETRRFELLGSLIGAIIAPALLSWFVGPSPALQFALASNVFAVIFATSAHSSVSSIPGVAGSHVRLPMIIGVHGAILLFFILARVPYSRFALLSGFVTHFVTVQLRLMALSRRQLLVGIVPGGIVPALPKGRVEWVVLQQPSIVEARLYDALIADFEHDLSPEWERFLADAALEGIVIHQAKSFAESVTGRVELGHLRENSFGSLVPVQGWFHIKAVIDRLTALLLLPVALPVMAAIAIAIRRDSRGPALFRQSRVGHAGKPFTMYKFRTMACHDQSADPRNLAQTQDSDTRITRLGRHLRKYRLDELPQLFNVLKGEMSFIGPRPEPAVLVDWYLEQLPYYPYRHVVRPGITGWAAVNQGHVNGLDQAQIKLQYDFYYIKYFAVWLDVVIVFRTIKTMVYGSGAR